jgi:hypothetical protein
MMGGVWAAGLPPLNRSALLAMKSTFLRKMSNQRQRFQRPRPNNTTPIVLSRISASQRRDVCLA